MPFPVVSSHHLTFAKKDGRYWVRDEGSTNGTKVDGQMLQPGQFIPVENGMQLQIVQLVLYVRLHHESTGAVEDFTLAQTGTLARKMLGEALEGDKEDLAFFEIANGNRAGTRVKLPDDLDNSFIGSADDCIVQIQGPGVPARALKLTYGPEGFTLIPADDVEVWHNGSKLTSRVVLTSGDRVTFNQRSLLFHDPLETQLDELEGLGGASDPDAQTVDAEAAQSGSSGNDTDQAQAVDIDDPDGQTDASTPEPSSGTGQHGAPDTPAADPAAANPSGTGPAPSPDPEPTGQQTGAPTGQQTGMSTGQQAVPDDDSSAGWGLMEVFLLLITLVFIVGVALILLVTFEVI